MEIDAHRGLNPILIGSHGLAKVTMTKIAALKSARIRVDENAVSPNAEALLRAIKRTASASQGTGRSKIARRKARVYLVS